jgi:hypothetical protein
MHINSSYRRFLMKNKSIVNLYNFNNELDSHPFLLKNRTGMFFLENFNYEKSFFNHSGLF